MCLVPKHKPKEILIFETNPERFYGQGAVRCNHFLFCILFIC